MTCFRVKTKVILLLSSLSTPAPWPASWTAPSWPPDWYCSHSLAGLCGVLCGMSESVWPISYFYSPPALSFDTAKLPTQSPIITHFLQVYTFTPAHLTSCSLSCFAALLLLFLTFLFQLPTICHLLLGILLLLLIWFLSYYFWYSTPSHISAHLLLYLLILSTSCSISSSCTYYCPPPTRSPSAHLQAHDNRACWNQWKRREVFSPAQSLSYLPAGC